MITIDSLLTIDSIIEISGLSNYKSAKVLDTNLVILLSTSTLSCTTLNVDTTGLYTSTVQTKRDFLIKRPIRHMKKVTLT